MRDRVAGYALLSGQRVVLAYVSFGCHWPGSLPLSRGLGRLPWSRSLALACTFPLRHLELMEYVDAYTHTLKPPSRCCYPFSSRVTTPNSHPAAHHLTRAPNYVLHLAFQLLVSRLLASTEQRPLRHHLTTAPRANVYLQHLNNPSSFFSSSPPAALHISLCPLRISRGAAPTFSPHSPPPTLSKHTSRTVRSSASLAPPTSNVLCAY